MIRDWWISIRFLCFVFQGSLFCDRPISGNNRLVTFVSQIFLIFLILVTSKNNAMSASFLREKIHSPSRFPSFPSQSRVVLSQAGRARYIVICINPAFTKMIDGTEKPKIPGAIRSTKISGNFGPKLDGSVRSNRKSFEKTGPCTF